MEPSANIYRLIEIMAALRDPVSGCAWDKEQTFASIAPYTIEEAYEVADAIAKGDLDNLRDELGDLLLQVVYHARMAEEAGEFAFGDVVQAVTAKMIRRHPHVFGEERAPGAAMAKGTWERIKSEEKRLDAQAQEARGLPAADAASGFLDDVPLALPALTRALKLQEKAARVGFDWKEATPILAKLEEEVAELREALAAGQEHAVREEFGDVLFSLVNLGRHLQLDSEAALRTTNNKFQHRFGLVERDLLAAGRSLEDASLDEMEALWQAVKGRR